MGTEYILHGGGVAVGGADGAKGDTTIRRV
jgi:hypothetical protein